MPKTMETQLPFSGFYDSLWSGMIDRQAEDHAEYEAEYRQAENGVPPELRLTADEIGDILYDVTDYRACYRAVAKTYVDMFSRAFKDYTTHPIDLTFSTMTSPRFYNFETDRLFATARAGQFYLLYRASRANGHADLEAVIRERFTSRDGFSSYYSNDIDDWTAKPFSTWDHNELETLLLATLQGAGMCYSGWNGIELDYIYSDWADSGYHEWQSGVDWAACSEKVEAARNAKAEALRSEDPGYVPPAPRCPDTIDMFPR